MKNVTVLLVLSLLACPLYASTLETTTVAGLDVSRANFLQETDITFWQTLPFVAFWTHFLDKQISQQLLLTGAPHWETILAVSVAVSFLNAVLQAKQVVTDERTRHNN